METKSNKKYIAAILSLMMAGIGQIYLGMFGRGIIILSVFAVLGAITHGIILPVLWILNVIDAYQLENGKEKAIFDCIGRA